MKVWHDKIPTGFWHGLIDLLAGARYYRLFKRCQYSGAAYFDRRFYRVTRDRQEAFKSVILADSRMHAIEQFDSIMAATLRAICMATGFKEGE